MGADKYQKSIDFVFWNVLKDVPAEPMYKLSVLLPSLLPGWDLNPRRRTHYQQGMDCLLLDYTTPTKQIMKTENWTTSVGWILASSG